MKTLIKNIGTLVTLKGALRKQGRKISSEDLEIQENTNLLIQDGIITAVGTLNNKCEKIIDARHCAVVPGFVDSHTHLVFAGSRSCEFEWRSYGQTYQEIHKKGGGILSTVKHTRKASENELFEKGFSYLKKMKEWGTTTVEIKSGYGLTFKDELKILRVIKKLSDQRIITVVPTFLGAHTCPIEYKGKPDDYIKLICNEMIPAVAKENLAVFCDVFIEIGGFSVRQAEKICEAAQKNALKIRLHVNQFSSLGGIELAKSLKVFSLDHLEGLEEKEIEALKHLDVTATLLPGVSFFLGSPYAQARKLIDNSIRIALASDFNPGSCMSYNLALMATIGITQMKMTFSEALAGITLNGAYSLDLQNTTGSLAGGKRADLIILNSNDFRLPFYHFGENHISKTFSYLDFL